MLFSLDSHPKLCPMSRHAASDSLPSCLGRSCDSQPHTKEPLEASLPRGVEGFFQVIKQATEAGRSLVRIHDMQLCSSPKMWVANSSHRKCKMEETDA